MGQIEGFGNFRRNGQKWQVQEQYWDLNLNHWIAWKTKKKRFINCRIVKFVNGDATKEIGVKRQTAKKITHTKNQVPRSHIGRHPFVSIC